MEEKLFRERLTNTDHLPLKKKKIIIGLIIRETQINSYDILVDYLFFKCFPKEKNQYFRSNTFVYEKKNSITQL